MEVSYLENLKTSNIQHTDEIGTAVLGRKEGMFKVLQLAHQPPYLGVKGLVHTVHQPLEHSLIHCLGYGPNGVHHL